MSEVLTIIKKSKDRPSNQQYIGSRQSRFKFMATQEQGPMVVDGYTVRDLSSPIIGYSLFFHGSSGPLVILDAAVNPLNKDMVKKVSGLIRKSVDSISGPGDTKMYFLGIYDLDASCLLKIMVREGQTSTGPEYAIRYAVSYR